MTLHHFRFLFVVYASNNCDRGDDVHANAHGDGFNLLQTINHHHDSGHAHDYFHRGCENIIRELAHAYDPHPNVRSSSE